MSRLLAVLLALGWTLASAQAEGKSRKSKSRDLNAQIAAEVEQILPGGLALASVTVPKTLLRHGAKNDVVALRWRKPPTHGRAIVQVLVHKRSGRIKKGWARIELVRLGDVVVAAVDLEAGALIEAGNLRVEERPYSDDRELQVEPAYLLGSRVVFARKAGEALRASDVSMPMPIARGTSVRVIVRRGGAVVATSGVLETKSMVGTATRVRVAGRLLAGKLTQADLVELGGLQ
ncbi:MAG: flagella basal body P-ring formation protein FlgA [Myxococcales bacterium]|nr:flagella basal body P-ring formation protein FlgA [Myxococcales bacterium]